MPEANLKARPNPNHDFIRTDFYLPVDGYITSPSGNCFLILQSDGNLCLYQGSPEKRGAHLWGSQRTAPGGQFFAIMQSDGNFCVYIGTPEKRQGLLWSYEKTFPGKEHFAVVQDDLNFVVYGGTGPNDNWGPHWDRMHHRQ